MINVSVPVKINPLNLYSPNEFQEGINIAIQEGMVYVVIVDRGSLISHPTNLRPEDL